MSSYELQVMGVKHRWLYCRGLFSSLPLITQLPHNKIYCFTISSFVVSKKEVFQGAGHYKMGIKIYNGPPRCAVALYG